MSITIAQRPDGVAVLTLDQPGSRANVLSTQLWNDLDAAAKQVGEMPGVKGAILASAKPGIFIAGADLKLLGEAGPNDPRVKEFIDLGNRVLARIESLPFATLAAVDGAALGGGLEVALACDFRLVGTNPKTQLGLPEVNLGLIPGWGGTQRLPRLVGLEKAAEMLSTGKSVSADDAIKINLALSEMDSAELIEAAAAALLNFAPAIRERARAAKRLPIPDGERAEFQPPIPSDPPAIREAMLVMVRGAALPLERAMPLETEAFMRLAGTDQSKTKIAAFFSRKK